MTVGRKFYPLDFDFRNVLKMMDILAREDLTPEAREYLALKCLTRHPRNVSAVLAAVKGTLFESKPGNGERLTSFEQDAGLIRSAFRQEYGINLFTDKLHWMEFIELLQNLPDGNRFEEVLGIRARPIPAATKYNAKEREALIKAKHQVALHLDEQEAGKKLDADISKVFGALMAMIPQEQKEVKTDGG